MEEDSLEQQQSLVRKALVALLVDLDRLRADGRYPSWCTFDTVFRLSNSAVLLEETSAQEEQGESK